MLALPAPAFAASDAAADASISGKAIAAAIVVGLAAAGGAIAMGMAIAKSVDGISRQPEAEGKIRTTLMLGLVFVETASVVGLPLCHEVLHRLIEEEVQNGEQKGEIEQMQADLQGPALPGSMLF